MAVLVSGGAGYIGSHMILELLSAGEEVVVLDNLSTGFRCVVDDAAHFINSDIADQGAVENAVAQFGIDAVVHFAGSIVVSESVANPLKYYENNTAKSLSFIRACVQSGISHFIFSSSAAVYGIPEANPVFEDAPLAPVSPYGSSKMMIEIMLRDVAATYGMRYAALRYFNVAGADPTGRTGQSTKEATHLVKLACQTALGQRPFLEVFGDDYPTGDGTCIRDYIHVTDLVRAHLLALSYLRRNSGSLILNCGYGRGYSVLEVIEAVKRISGRHFDVHIAPRRPGDPAVLVAGAQRVRATLGWKPAYDDLSKIVTHAYAWEQRLLRE